MAKNAYVFLVEFLHLILGYRRKNIEVLKIEPYDNAFSKQLHRLWNNCLLTHIGTVSQHRFFNQVNKIRSKMKEILDFRALT